MYLLDQYRISLKQRLLINKDNRALISLAKIYAIGGENEKALEYIRKALRIEPDSPTNLLAIVFEVKKNTISQKEVLDILSQLQEQSKTEKEEYNSDSLEGLMYVREGRFSEAEKSLKKAFNDGYRNERSLINLAISYRQLQELEKARGIYGTLIKENEYSLVARYNLGNLYASQGKTKEALQQYIIVSDLVPGYQLTPYYMGKLYEGDNRKELAREEYTKFITFSENDERYTIFYQKL